MEINLVTKSQSPFGLDSLMELSYSAAAKSKLNFEQRRKLVFSLYSLRCLFDNLDYLEPPSVLIEHGCCFLLPISAHPDLAYDKAFLKSAISQKDAVLLSGGGVLIDYTGEKRVKFDSGSELFEFFVRNGQISDKFSIYPQKYQLLECVEILISLPNSSDELKALWFLLFPFLFSDAPDLNGHFSSIKSKLSSQGVYQAAAISDLSALVPDKPEETFINTPYIAMWFKEFSVWREKNFSSGASSDESSTDEIAKTLEAAEELFKQNPNNEEILLLLLAARTNQPPEKQSILQLRQNISLITGFLPLSKNKALLTYYLGLTFLALRQTDKAKRTFQICLEFKPDYKPAILMLDELQKLEEF